MTGISRNDILAGYLDEVNTYIPTLVQTIETLKQNPNAHEAMEELHRLVHTVKGASAMVGIQGLIRCHSPNNSNRETTGLAVPVAIPPANNYPTSVRKRCSYKPLP